MKTIKELLELHGNEYANIQINFFNRSNGIEMRYSYSRYENKEMTIDYFKSLTALKQFIENKFNKTIDTVETAEAQIEEELGNNDKNECPQCHVGLNKDGKCPSCEQDHAQKAYEDEQAGIAESAMAEQAAEEAGRYESKKEGA